jgi:electron transport complex protein RnfC
MKVYSFPRGGISFEDPSAPSRNSIVTAFLPSLSVIPLVQHSWGRAYPVVSIGDTVREGMLIGRGQGMGSANVHATVPGRVIKMVSWKMAGGQVNEALVIRLEGSFEKLGKQEETFSWEGMLPYDLQRLIAEYGAIEMDGGGRSISDIIASLRDSSEPISLVVRCVFDDPWLAADYVHCKERLKTVVEGSRIIARIMKAVRIIYAVSYREKELGERFIQEAGNWDPPSFLVLVGSRYPQRNRRELELVLRNYGKKEGIELGAFMILGPVTLSGVHDAVKLRKPVLDRYIAVGGSAVKNPQIIKARIGKRVGEIFAECGGFTRNPRRIVAGSPLIGRAIADLDEPITKTSYGIFASLDGPKVGTAPGTCISCGVCRNVCPIGLDPEEFYKRSRMSGKLREEFSQAGAAECHGCRCCDVVCPSRLPLSSSISALALRGN